MPQNAPLTLVYSRRCIYSRIQREVELQVSSKKESNFQKYTLLGGHEDIKNGPQVPQPKRDFNYLTVPQW